MESMFLGNINVLDHEKIARTACPVLANGLVRFQTVLPAQILSCGCSPEAIGLMLGKLKH